MLNINLLSLRLKTIASVYLGVMLFLFILNFGFSLHIVFFKDLRYKIPKCQQKIF